MNKSVAALQISNSYYELVIGYVLDEKVDILYKVRNPLSVSYKDGDIYDFGSLSDDLSKINNIEANISGHKLRINVNEIVLVLPSYGLEVYHTSKTTNTVSNVSKIARIDISNALALVKKEKLPNLNNVLVDIVPNYFKLDNGKEFITPPINETSLNITLDANVYTLPGKMAKELKSVCEKAGLKVIREVISPIGVSNLLQGLRYKQDTYLIVDFGNKTTTLSFIGKNTLYASNFFSIGIDDLVERYMEEMQISKEKAIEIKNTYGFDVRKTEYSPAIVTKVGLDGVKRNYTKEDVSYITLNFLKQWLGMFKGSFDNLMDNYQRLKNTITLVFIGEGSRLNGLKDYVLKNYNSNPLEILTLPTVGCREGEFVSCLGAIYTASSYRGALEDESRNQVSELNRESDTVRDRSDKVREKYTELRDEL